MTPAAYRKILEKRINARKKTLGKLSKKRYNPFSYSDYNAFYIQEEIRFIHGIMVGVAKSNSNS